MADDMSLAKLGALFPDVNQAMPEAYAGANK